MTQETKLKFYTSQETGKLVSFVSVTKAKRLKGVRDDSDCKKKIVVLSSDLTDSLKPNVLYNVILTEMKNKKGYVVKSATPVLFEAEIAQWYTRYRLSSVTKQYFSIRWMARVIQAGLCRVH